MHFGDTSVTGFYCGDDAVASLMLPKCWISYALFVNQFLIKVSNTKQSRFL